MDAHARGNWRGFLRRFAAKAGLTSAVLLCGLVLLIWIASLKSQFCYKVEKLCVVCIHDGTFNVCWGGPKYVLDREYALFAAKPSWNWGFCCPAYVKLTVDCSSEPVFHRVIIPLWFVLLAVGLPVIFWLIWNRTGRVDPLGCRCCGYCLEGNASGICPECGRPVPESMRKALVEVSQEKTAGAED